MLGGIHGIYKKCMGLVEDMHGHLAIVLAEKWVELNVNQPCHFPSFVHEFGSVLIIS